MTAGAEPTSASPFRHEAYLYETEHDYLVGLVPFIEDGLAAGQAVLVAVPEPRLDLLRPRFERDSAELLQFAPMEEMGRNPARIIPAWAAFVARHAETGRGARGIGEPIWPDRSGEELIECARHEALLNLAFAEADGFTLMCPYQTSTLPHAVIREARRNHPHVIGDDDSTTDESFRGDIPDWLEVALPPPPPDATDLTFDGDSLSAVRQRVADAASAADLSRRQIDDIRIAVGEAAANSITHGGGSGHIVVWDDGDAFVCEIRDHGRITDPLAGRIRPGLEQSGGRGMWLMNQLCDLVQVRVGEHGQSVRLHLRH